MRTIFKPAAIAAALGLLAAALPASAASGDVVSIALRDFNHNGKIDRAVVAIGNPGHAVWSVQDASGVAIAYDGTSLRIADVFVASASADPALLEIVIDETDAHLPVSTSTDGFEVSYASVGSSGVQAAGIELTAFAADDVSAAVTEKDEASPILMSSTPVVGSFEVPRTANLTLTFSESIEAASLQPTSSQNPGSWSISTSDGGRSFTVGHFAYAGNVNESFGIAGLDLAGNALVRGSYPNPFTFRTTDDSTPATQVDNVFALTSPLAFDTLYTSQPTVIAWYTNQAAVTALRLSYSSDAGQTYTKIADVPVAAGVHVWYPPKLTSSFQLRAEGLNVNGAPIASTNAFPISVTGDALMLQVISGPEVSLPSASSALVTVRLNLAPASAMLACEGLSPVPATLSGDRPVQAEASLTGLIEGQTYVCTFVLTDASGLETRLSVPTVRPELDTSGPILIGPAVIDRFDVAARTARLTWTTDEPSSASVSYGLELNYGGQASDGALATEHEVTLLGLTVGAMHQVRVTSIDGAGNAAVSRDYYFVFLREGDLIKGAGPAVYWHKGGKRSVFPHIDVYRSWFGQDFSKVIRVPDTQLGTIPLAANVTMKEGVYLVKIQSDPKTYAVEPNGVLRWVQTEAQARQLYGDAWAQRVRDVDVSLFADYAIGAPLASGERPAGYLN